jgi:MoxR-like ATPase
VTTPDPPILFGPESLEALHVPGVGERWAAVQERLHPQLAALAERLAAAASRRAPQLWLLYELSYKTQRYVNKGRSSRAPIDEYHFAVDRPPRGSGVYLSVSGAERALLVGLQLWGPRKGALRDAWREGRAVFAPLVARIGREGQARFRGQEPGDAEQEPGNGEQASWLDAYLEARGASYLWAGFVYSWDDARLGEAAFAERLIDDILELLALNEAVMERAELLAPAPATLHDDRAAYLAQGALPSADEIVAAINAQRFTYPEATLRAYHVALQTRPLVILPGISGTGKTRLTRLYADAVHRIPLGANNPYYLLVAVQPDWHNARDLLGYYNALSGAYHPTAFLRHLLRAAADPASLYFVCLDEMNLARPEYYLAPILSALETAEHTIDLGIPGPLATTLTGETLTNPLRLPLNLRLSGTLNVDESAHALSDKLLDRANVIELVDVDLAAFRRNYLGPVSEPAWQAIVAAHAVLSRLGQPFGYRTVAEMLRFLEQARGVLDPQVALDLQIKQKILPKLRGEDTPRLRRALDELLALLEGLPQSAEKVARMRERLLADGFTDFYG